MVAVCVYRVPTTGYGVTSTFTDQLSDLLDRLLLLDIQFVVLGEWLQSEFGVTDTSLDWLRSYLETRTQFVKLGTNCRARRRRSAGLRPRTTAVRYLLQPGGRCHCQPRSTVPSVC